MSTNQTPNYGLSQWEATDPFIRADFNQDHSRIDSAIKSVADGVDRLSDKLVPISYNVYNLALQSYYEGKHTGWKKALVFDGFLDDANVAATTGGVLIRDGAARVYRTGEPSYTLGIGNAERDLRNTAETQTITATGGGRLTAIHVPCKPFSGRAAITVIVRLNGSVVLNMDHQTTLSGCTRIDIPFAKAVTVLPGDKYSVSLHQTEDSPITTYADYTGKSWTLSCTIDVAPGTVSGTLTGRTADVGRWDRLLLWVRRSAGTVTPQVNGGALTLVSSRETENLQGSLCTEDCREGPAGSGTLAVKLNLNCGGGGSCLVYDYGVVVM